MMKKYIKNIDGFISSFLCITIMIMITFFDFITEKLTISIYLEREREEWVYQQFNNVYIYDNCSSYIYF